jgi:hypothetical protein
VGRRSSAGVAVAAGVVVVAGVVVAAAAAAAVDAVGPTMEAEQGEGGLGTTQ